MSYRFRDVYDHLVQLTDESLFFADRITSLLDAHLSTVSNQLNGMMKILTIIATIFMPLMFITGLYGMNVELPQFGLERVGILLGAAVLHDRCLARHAHVLQDAPMDMTVDGRQSSVDSRQSAVTFITALWRFARLDDATDDCDRRLPTAD